MPGLIDFNNLAQQMAGLMPALPQFDFQPITIPGGSGGGGGNDVPNMNGPLMGGMPAQPPTGTAGSTRPGAIGSIGDLGNQLNSMYGVNSAPSWLSNDFMSVPGMEPFEGSSFDWGSIGRGAQLGGMFLGPLGLALGAGAGAAFGGQGDVPSAVRYAGVPGVSQTDAALDAWMANPENFSEGLLDIAPISADEVDLSFSARQQGPTSAHQSGIEYGGLPGLNPAAVAVINRRLSPQFDVQK